MKKITVVYKFQSSDSIALPPGWTPIGADAGGVWAWKRVKTKKLEDGKREVMSSEGPDGLHAVEVSPDEFL